MFIVIDGEDYTGKSSVIKKISEKYPNIITTNDPNSDLEFCKNLRSILLEGDEIDKLSQLYLFLSARCELNSKIIKPNLDKFILCDRYVPSTIAYQIFGKENPEYLLDVICSEDNVIQSDLTVLLTVNKEERAKRANNRDKVDNFDKMSTDFFDKVSSGYKFCYNSPEFIRTNKIIEIDTSDKSIDDVVNILLDLPEFSEL